MSNKVDDKQSSNLLTELYESAAEGASAAADEVVEKTKSGVKATREAAGKLGEHVEDKFEQGKEHVGEKFREAIDDGAEVGESMVNAVGGLAEDAEEGMNALGEGVQDLAKATIDHGAEQVKKVADAKDKLTEQAGLTLDAYPHEEVVELGQRFLDGESSIGEAVVGLAQATFDAEQQLERDVAAIELELAEEGAQLTQQHHDAIESYAQSIEDFWSSPTMSAQAAANPALMATRTVSLELTDTIGDLPELSEEFAAKKSEIREWVDMGSLSRTQSKLDEMKVGGTYSRGSSIAPGAVMGMGGDIKISTNTDIEKTADETYRVTIQSEGGGSIDFGSEGAKTGGEGSAGRSVTLEVSGPGAARDAALLATGVVESPSRLLLLNNPPDVVAGNIALAAAWNVELPRVGGDIELGEFTGFRKEDGDVILEKKLSASFSQNYETEIYAQLDDEFQDAIEHGDDYSVSDDVHPGIRNLMEELPDGLIDSIREVHGDGVGVSIGAAGSTTATFWHNTDTDTNGLALELGVELAVGETTYDATQSVSIDDLDEFERDLQGVGVDSMEVARAVRNGEMPPAEILALVAEHKEAFSDCVTIETRLDSEHSEGTHIKIGEQEAFETTSSPQTLYHVRNSDTLQRFAGVESLVPNTSDTDDGGADEQVARQKLNANLSKL